MFFTDNRILFNIKKEWKGKEILTQSVTMMNLEGIMLTEICHPQRTNIIQFHLHEFSRTVKFIETESRTVGATGWRKEVMGYLLWGERF